tara:strand:- start:13107 stop:13937 length:831 start_codon:yes stop_codon:yes gene_type:complete
MRNYEKDYIALVQRVIEFGATRKTRNGYTRQLFGETLKINELMRGEFPLLTGRKMFYRPVLGELAAFLRGATDLQTFKDFGCNYWDANAAAWPANKGLPPSQHEVGQIYGAQWRDWQGLGHDQLRVLIRGLLQEPSSRRHLLTTYDPEETNACLPPCHLLAQFNVTNERTLDCCVYMRSVDLCLGLPSDVVLYAALMILIGNETDLHPGQLTFMFGDTHIYANHADIWKLKYLGAMPHPMPGFKLHAAAELTDFAPEHLEITNYQHGERIDYPFNV